MVSVTPIGAGSRARARASSGGSYGATPLPGLAPAGPQALALLSRARRALEAARTSDDGAERFRLAHLAALRAAAAVLATYPLPAHRGRPRPVWETLAARAPSLGTWAAYFAAGSATRAAIESGRSEGVPAEVADHLMTMAGIFLSEVESRCSVARAS